MHSIINNGDIVAVKVFFSFLNEGKSKRRPVLVIGHEDGTLTFLALTSKFEEKSPMIKLQYYALVDWKTVGLNKSTFVDVLSARKVRIELLDQIVPIGQLTNRDKENLVAFIKTYQMRLSNFELVRKKYKE